VVFTCWPVKPARFLKGIDMSWSQYEFLKSEWISKSPFATHQEYQDAIKKIARECGV